MPCVWTFFALVGGGLSLAANSVTGAPVAGPGPTLAYLDPGSGSFLVQVIVATVAGASVALHRYWSRVKGWLRRGTVTDEDESRDDDT